MPSLSNSWPPWPEYQSNVPQQAQDTDFIRTKKTLLAKYGSDRLRKNWILVCQRLLDVTEEITRRGSDLIPIVPASSILQNGLTAEEEACVRRTGCLVVKGVLAKADADRMYRDLQTFLEENKESVRGWPAESPSMLKLFNTPIQSEIRSNPNHLKLQRYFNNMWHDTTNTSTADPLVYLDGLRDRPPGQRFLGLGPHIDAGSLSRWADQTYQQAYEDIFSGNFDKYDPWDLSLRQYARQDLFPSEAHSPVFRAFQGWTALTKTAPGQGSLLLYPELAASIAYVLLRPFFSPPSRQEDIMDAIKWTINDSESFPGTEKEQSQRLSRSSHPHLRLEECMTYIPQLEAGDTVWWHSDLCHAVDPVHSGTENAAVAYIAACPTTEKNKYLIKAQHDALMACPLPPQDEARL